MCSSVSLHDKTRERFSEKTIVAFTNSTVFMLDFYISLFGLNFGLWVPSKGCIRYIIGVLCYNFKSQTFLLYVNTLVCVKAEI